MAGIAACACLFFLWNRFREDAARKQREADTRTAVTVLAPAEEAGTADTAPAEEGTWDGTGAVLSVDFETLLAENPDTVAWLHMPATGLNDPVVHYAEDNDYYLHRAFDGSESAAGSIYLECTNGPDFADAHSLVYGHNMADGSMFGALQRRMQTEDAWKTEPYFYLYLKDGSVCRYLVFSFYETEKNSDTYVTFSEEDAYDWYVYYAKTRSEAETGQEDAGLFLERPPVVTLSTCAGPAGTTRRFVVHGVQDGRVKRDG